MTSAAPAARTPLGELRDNTTPHLIADMETLRKHLGIERWLVFGGSWGSTLALAYAEHHPERTMALILRGIFLCRRSRRSTGSCIGLATCFPGSVAAVCRPPCRIRLSATTPEAAFSRRITRCCHNPDPAVHLPGGAGLEHLRRLLFDACCPTKRWWPISAPTGWRSGWRASRRTISCNDIFLPENFLMDHVGRIRHIPTTIVQGRYDVVCPIVSADDLARAFPEADYHIVKDAGHSAFEPGTRAKLIEATENGKHSSSVPRIAQLNVDARKSS